MKCPTRFFPPLFLLMFLAPIAAKADRNSVLLVTCETAVPYFSIETLVIDTDADIGRMGGGNGLRSLRSLIDHPITCVVGEHQVEAALTKFYPTHEHMGGGLEAADIIVRIDGAVAATLEQTHRVETSADGRGRVEVDAYRVLTCESTSNDWARPIDMGIPKDARRRSLLCVETFLSY